MDFLKSFIVCALVVMATTSAYKLTEIHDNFIVKEFPMGTGEIYSGLEDYIQLDKQDSLSTHESYFNKSLSSTAESIDAIVEIAIICDKEWGDLFQHDRQKILEYWTAFFWDVNVKFQTLPSVNITFRITSLTVSSSLEEQPFIEESRDENGAAIFSTVLWRFGDWIAQQQLDGKVANYDIAVLAVNTLMQGSILGMAYGPSACSKNRGVGLFRNRGVLDTYVASHEIGHILGAGHDSSTPWCTESGYIMQSEADKAHFFSWCSDVMISQYVGSSSANCLRTIDGPASPVIGQDFAGALAPSGQDQCRRYLADPTAVLPEAEQTKCRDAVCLIPETGRGYRLGFGENTECALSLAPWGNEYGRCFRSTCLPPSAQLVNVASNECLMSSGGRFSSADNTIAVVASCPQQQTPLNSIWQSYWNDGSHLETAYASADASEIGSKCFAYKEDEQIQLRFDRDMCWDPTDSGYAGWKLIDVGNEHFLLSHTRTKKCVKQVGNVVEIADNCDENDKSMVWRFRK